MQLFCNHTLMHDNKKDAVTNRIPTDSSSITISNNMICLILLRVVLFVLTLYV